MHFLTFPDFSLGVSTKMKRTKVDVREKPTLSPEKDQYSTLNYDGVYFVSLFVIFVIISIFLFFKVTCTQETRKDHTMKVPTMNTPHITIIVGPHEKKV